MMCNMQMKAAEMVTLTQPHQVVSTESPLVLATSADVIFPQIHSLDHSTPTQPSYSYGFSPPYYGPSQMHSPRPPD
ncbi:hypothetical protein TSUD_255940 [Trifolium subterraneum]|uniref:Uncharacterized protein n=1 Tax=Trifolium subterraneum TaxID=3900 RepID=A0A2Z6MP32_TRISU|nr:hypothetical protein TSUD_255940 [Trifolium subterraneum]